MLLNHARKMAGEWDDAIPSLCPDCAGALLAKRGRINLWHWAHRTANPAGGKSGCGGVETYWHLVWKMVYHEFPGWDIEVPYEIGGQSFRLDAANLARSKAREFVHSLTEKYILKHLALARAGLDIAWIFDGAEFGAARMQHIRRGGIRHPLKPKARWVQARIGGLIHLDGMLWREWKADCWYPLESGRCDGLTESFSRKLAQLEMSRPGVR